MKEPLLQSYFQDHHLIERESSYAGSADRILRKMTKAQFSTGIIPTYLLLKGFASIDVQIPTMLIIEL